MNLLKLEPLTDEYLESIGFKWHTDEDNTSYISNEVVEVSEDEANAYYEATNESINNTKYHSFVNNSKNNTLKSLSNLNMTTKVEFQ